MADMTWAEYRVQCARRLAECRNREQFDAELRRIDKLIAEQPPPDGERQFWADVLSRYRLQPKPLLKESTAAAALNALLQAADAILAQRAAPKK